MKVSLGLCEANSEGGSVYLFCSLCTAHPKIELVGSLLLLGVPRGIGLLGALVWETGAD
jgi:hypothetical protein